MKRKIRRIFFGLVIPTIIAIVICGVFYFKNAHQEVMNELAAYEGDTSEQMKGIIIRKDNWQEYFVLEEKEDGYYFQLKEEYYDKIATERASYVNINFSEEIYLTWSSSHGKDFAVILNITEPVEMKVEKIAGELYLKK